MEKILTSTIGIWSFLGANIFSLDAPFLTIQTAEDLTTQTVVEESISQEIEFRIANESHKNPAIIESIVFQLKTNTQKVIGSYRLESSANDDIDLGFSTFSKTGFATLYMHQDLKPEQSADLTIKLHIPPLDETDQLELFITKIKASYTNEGETADLNVFHNFQTISLLNAISIQKIEVVEKPKLLVSDGIPTSISTLHPGTDDYTLLNISLEVTEPISIKGLYARNDARNLNYAFEEYMRFKLFDSHGKQIGSTKMNEGKLFFDLKDSSIVLTKEENTSWSIKAKVPYFINSIRSSIEILVDTSKGNQGFITSNPAGREIEVLENIHNGVIHTVPVLTEAPQDIYPDIFVKDIKFLKGKTSEYISKFDITICNDGVPIQGSEETPANIAVSLESEIFSAKSTLVLREPFEKDGCKNTIFELSMEDIGNTGDEIIQKLYPINVTVNNLSERDDNELNEANESNNQLTKEVFINLVYEEKPNTPEEVDSEDGEEEIISEIAEEEQEEQKQEEEEQEQEEPPAEDPIPETEQEDTSSPDEEVQHNDLEDFKKSSPNLLEIKPLTTPRAKMKAMNTSSRVLSTDLDDIKSRFFGGSRR